MFNYLSTAAKVIIFIIILIAIIGLLTCIGLLVENIKTKKQRKKQGYVDNKKYDLNIIVPSTIIGVSTVAIVLSIAVPAAINANIKVEREKNSTSFKIDTPTSFENYLDALPIEKIKEAKPASKVVLRNYELGFTYSYKTKSYIIDEKANAYSLIGYKIGKQDYFFSPIISSDKQIYNDITPNKSKYDFELRDPIRKNEPTIDDYKNAMKNFSSSLFIDDFLKSEPDTYVFSAKVVYGVERLSGYVCKPNETTPKLYEESEITKEYRHNYALNISVAKTHGGLLNAKPNRKITYIL